MAVTFPTPRLLAVLAGFLLAHPASAQAITDGDTLKLDGMTYRLWGIDAPETRQVCADGWGAGIAATNMMRGLVAGRAVTCEPRSTDRYGRTR